MTSLVTMTNAPVFVIESNSSIKKTAGLALWMDFIEVYFHCSFSCQTELFQLYRGSSFYWLRKPGHTYQ